MPLGKIVILLGWRVQRPFRGFVVDAIKNFTNNVILCIGFP